jgi:uncharacterized protein (TIGR03435 family)
MTRLVTVLMMLAGSAVLAAAQARVAPTPEFDVASLKPTSFRFFRPLDGVEQMCWKTRCRWSDRLFSRDAPLRGLIQMAYDVWGHQIEGLPAWVDSARYEIDARAPGARSEEMRAMMRTLLADRFQLALHRETRTLPVLELVRAEGTRRIAPMPEGGCFELGTNSEPIPFSPPPAPMPKICDRFRRIVVTPAPALVERIEAVGVSMSQLVGVLSAEVGRIVIDRTGFTDTFSYEVNFAPDRSSDIPGAAAGRGIGDSIEVPRAPSISVAIKEQLGLELKPSTGPVEVLVVDRIERPSPN